MIDAFFSFVSWVVGKLFGGGDKDAALKKSGATEVKLDEATTALRKTTDADKIRDAVAAAPAPGLRDDDANLYRD